VTREEAGGKKGSRREREKPVLAGRAFIGKTPSVGPSQLIERGKTGGMGHIIFNF